MCKVDFAMKHIEIIMDSLGVVREILYNLYLVFFNGSILQNYNTVSQLEC